MQRAQVPGRMTDPIRQRGSIQIDAALASIDLGLPVQRQMVGIFGHQNLCDGGLGRHAALDKMCRCRGLQDAVLASPAGVFRSPGDEYPELRRHHVQPLALVLADPVQLSAAAGTGLVIDVDDDLDPRQMRRQRPQNIAYRTPLTHEETRAGFERRSRSHAGGCRGGGCPKRTRLSAKTAAARCRIGPATSRRVPAAEGDAPLEDEQAS